MALLEEMTVEDFETYVLRSREPVLVAYVADSALPSHQMLSALEWIGDDKSVGPVKMYLYDVDGNAVPEDVDLPYIPTLALYAGGKEITRLAGQTPLPRIKEWLCASVH